MAKITVHGGPSNAAITGATWGDPPDETAEPVTVGETGPELVELPAGAQVSAANDGQAPGELVEEGQTEGSLSEPLPEAVEDDPVEHVSEPAYASWSFDELKAECKKRDLSAGGGAHACLTRLVEHDEAKAAAAEPEGDDGP